jgi:dihydrofolate reductase
MRKIIMLNRISIDGFFAGPNGESYEWFVMDTKVDKASRNIVGEADTGLFGWVTYQIFENHWPRVAADPKAPKEEKAVANELNEMTKVVFSKTLKEVTWENSELVKGDLAKEVRKLKQEEGTGTLIFDSGTIIQ